MSRNRKSDKWELEPQKASAAQMLTYIASTGASSEKFEIRYEDESIWMSQKMLAAVYGVEVPNIAYHPRKIFEDAELDKGTSIKEILIDVGDGRRFAAQLCAESEFEKYRIVQDKLFMSDYDRYLLALEEEAKKGHKGK